MNDLLLRALRCEETERPPVWFMRQAGRFLPEYRLLRKQYSLSTLFHTPELAKQVTELPLSLLGVDAAILFSDILVITEVFGYKIYFPEEGGIALIPPSSFKKREVKETLAYVGQTIQLLKSSLKVPLIGFCGGPYTVAKYMDQINHKTLKALTEASIEYLYMQIEQGVDVVQIFDSWAGLLEEPQFKEFSLSYLREIIESLRPTKVPVILFLRGSCKFCDELVGLNPAAISFDWKEKLEELQKRIPLHITIQGNLDPEILKQGGETLEKEVGEILETMQERPGFIFNLGHGVLPETPVEHAQSVIHKIKSTQRMKI